ncbi:MAG: hypothetical protein KAS04_01270 [Candidatus Aenigmarchaeota archaeon]|nr:hypothetical protein [Candidatus Aenigmarchaeota archaeon]
MAKLHIKNKYGVTPNAVLNSCQLSFKAKGLYGYLQSKPDSWKFSISRIAKQTKDGEYGIKGAIKELEKYKLLRRRPVKNHLGKWFGYDYELVDFPLAENPPADNPSTDNPLTGNHTPLSKKESSKKDIVRKKKGKPKSLAGYKKETEGEKIGTAKLVAELIEAFTVVNPACKEMYGNITQRDACEFLLKEYEYAIVLQVIKLLPKTNLIKFIPTITTPLQLRDNWVRLEAGLIKLKKAGTNVYKNKGENIASKITKQLNAI